MERLRKANEFDDEEDWDEDILEVDGWDDDELVEREAWTGSQPIAQTPTEDLADALGACGLNIYIDLPEELVRRGEDAVPALARIIEDPRLAQEKEGRSWAAYHALGILGCIRSESAIPLLMNSLKLLQHRPFLDWMVAASTAALRKRRSDGLR